MKASEAAKLLADRVNQLHYVESIMEKVYKCGLRDATTPPPQSVSAELEYHGKTLEYWKQNAEEDYIKVPISVLKYITVLESFAHNPHSVKFTPERTAKEEADYKTILEKYLHHVMVCEGSDYVEHCTSPSVVFTESEWNVLKQLSKQVNGLNPYPTTK
jgi:hypothetical protein